MIISWKARNIKIKLLLLSSLLFFNKLGILSTNQYGFRQIHSTSLAMIDFVERINTAMTKVTLDLAKAFDTVNHAVLLDKLEHCGIRGIPLLWFKNHLSNRKQYVQYNCN